MAESLYSRLGKLCLSDIDLSQSQGLLDFQSKERFAFPLIAEDSSAFYAKLNRSGSGLPFEAFVPDTSKFTAKDRDTLTTTFRETLNSPEYSSGRQALFLAAGFLRWFTDKQGTIDVPQISPALIIPVQVNETTLAISAAGLPLENPFLRNECEKITAMPAAADFKAGGSFEISAYFSAFEKATCKIPHWKFTARGLSLMFLRIYPLYAMADIGDAEWKAGGILQKHPVIPGLLSEEGFRLHDYSLEDKNIDDVFDIAGHHFTNAVDASATKAILNALRPENGIYAIQAPVGSSRDEVAENIIAESIAQKKRTLIVYRNKATTERLSFTGKFSDGALSSEAYEKLQSDLGKSRENLRLYYKAVNTPLPPEMQPLEKALLAIAKGDHRRKKVPEDVFAGADFLSVEKVEEAGGILLDYIDLLEKPEAKKDVEVFKNSSLTEFSETKKTDIQKTFKEASSVFGTLTMLARAIDGTYFFNKDVDLDALEDVKSALTPDFGPQTPSFDGWDLQSKEWDVYADDLQALPDAGSAWSKFRREGSKIYTDAAVDENISDARDIIAENIDKTFKLFSEYYRDAREVILHTLRKPDKIKDDKELLKLADNLLELRNHRDLYKNSSALANRLCGEDWKFEKTNWTGLSSKIHWLYAFRKKLQGKDNANLSLALLSNYRNLQAVIPDADGFTTLCRSGKKLFEKLQKALGFAPAGGILSVVDEAALIETWDHALPALNIAVQIHAKCRELTALGLAELAGEAERSPDLRPVLKTEFVQYWNSRVVQNANKLDSSLFSVSPKDRSRAVKQYRSLLSGFLNANKEILRGALEKDSGKLVLLSAGNVSRILPPKSEIFDIAIFLDAESIPPAEALPAILRAKKAVLIGDSALPPYAAPIPAHLSSILAFALYKGAPNAFLSLDTKHAHPVLFEFANEETYDGRIKALPQPTSAPAACISVRVEDSPERAIAEAAVIHAEHHPKESLGIIAFSEARLSAIRKELDSLLQRHKDCEAFFNQKDAVNGFYIKTPENAVNDYRDTLLVFAEVTPAVTTPGLGTKLINLCATHAMGELRIFTAETLQKPSASGNPGLRAYWKWLQYANSAPRKKMYSGNSLVSPFVERILEVLDGNKLSLETNWGFRGADLAIAVHDANNPERFLLAIETDSDKGFLRESLEDREYLRPMILEKLGWKIIRLWLPQWFKAESDERGHVLTTIAVEQSVAAPPQGKAAAEELGPETDEENADFSTIPYRIVNPRIAGTAHDNPIPDLPPKLLLLQVKFFIDNESPVHEECLLRRLLALHRVGRAGPGILRAIKTAIDLGIERKTFIKTGPFFYSLKNRGINLRNREALPDEERSLTFVPPEERALFPEGTDKATIKKVLGLL